MRTRATGRDDKPLVVSVHKYAVDHSSGVDADYERFIFAGTRKGVPLTDVFGYAELTTEQAIRKLDEMGWDLPEEIVDETDEDRRLDELVEWARENGKSDNTYNWSWWGPTLNFTVVYEQGEDEGLELLFVRAHQGGDVRGNYGRDHIFEIDSADNSWTLTVTLKLEDGSEVILDSEDTEASNWYVGQDPSGTLKEGSYVKNSKVEEAFDWDDGVHLW